MFKFIYYKVYFLRSIKDALFELYLKKSIQILKVYFYKRSWINENNLNLVKIFDYLKKVFPQLVYLSI